MKWISQYIQSLIARFRNDVYLENLSSGDFANDGDIGLDSNNKLVKSNEWSLASGTVGHKDRALMSKLTLWYSKSMTPGNGSMLHIASADITDNNTSASGTASAYSTVNISANRVLADNASVTTTNAASLYIQGAPIAHTNQTITNAYALWIDAGSARFDGDVDVDGTLEVDAFKGTGSVTITNILDEDAMGTNSNTALATQQSIKAYADTKISLSATKQITFHQFTDDMGTTKQYIGLVEADAENTNTANKYLPFPAITAGKLIKVALRSNKNLTGHQITFRLEKIGAANPNSATPDILGAQTGAGCNNSTMTTYDFTTGLDSGEGGETNAFSASDLVYLSIQSDTDFGSNVIYYITCIWEFDLSE